MSDYFGGTLYENLYGGLGYNAKGRNKYSDNHYRRQGVDFLTSYNDDEEEYYDDESHDEEDTEYEDTEDEDYDKQLDDEEDTEDEETATPLPRQSTGPQQQTQQPALHVRTDKGTPDTYEEEQPTLSGPQPGSPTPSLRWPSRHISMRDRKGSSRAGSA